MSGIEGMKLSAALNPWLAVSSSSFQASFFLLSHPFHLPEGASREREMRKVSRKIGDT